MADRFSTIGLEQDGFADPSKQYPRREYTNVATTNLAAQGAKENDLYLGGGDTDIDLELNPTVASQYPLNNVRETVSGHVTEIDDTPGSERILFRHRTGAGVEMRSDGSVIISSRHNTIRVSGGDEKVIIEGDGQISYNGNLTLNVAGDFDVRVGGNYNVHVAGDEEREVRGSHISKVHRNHQTTVVKNVSNYILGSDTKTIYGDQHKIIKGASNEYVEGDMQKLSGGTLTTTAENEIVMTAPNINIAANDLTAIGDEGTIGGENIIMYNYNMYTGHSIEAGDTVDATTLIASETMTSKEFIGSLTGNADTATQAGRAGTAGALGAGGSAGTKVTGTAATIDTTATELPTATIMSDYLDNSSKGVRKINIDPGSIMKNQIDKSTDYGGIASYRLNTKEIRSKLRDPQTLANKKFVGAQIAEGKLSASYINAFPPATGRKIGSDPAPRRGSIPIGGSSAGATKRFSK